MGGEICKFKTGSKKVLPADSAAALSPPGPSHFRHGRPLDIQLTLAGHFHEVQHHLVHNQMNGAPCRKYHHHGCDDILAIVQLSKNL